MPSDRPRPPAAGPSAPEGARMAASPVAGPASGPHPWWLALARACARIGPLWLAVGLLPLPVLLGAAVGEGVARLLGVPVAGAGALCGGLAVMALALPVAAWAWRLARDTVPAPTPVDTGATRDALTGAFTQRHFVAAADREWSRIRRHGEDAALLMVDADHFRTLNERHGQACGDAVLVEITRLVSATLRQYDLMARFGGGVLVVYLPHTDPIGALDVAERIRERVANLRVMWSGQAVGATVSIGVASIGPDHAALDAVIADAGAALREAKAAGRNCVRAAPIQPKRNGENRPVISR